MSEISISSELIASILKKQNINSKINSRHNNTSFINVNSDISKSSFHSENSHKSNKSSSSISSKISSYSKSSKISSKVNKKYLEMLNNQGKKISETLKNITKAKEKSLNTAQSTKMETNTYSNGETEKDFKKSEKYNFPFNNKENPIKTKKISQILNSDLKNIKSENNYVSNKSTNSNNTNQSIIKTGSNNSDFQDFSFQQNINILETKLLEDLNNSILKIKNTLANSNNVELFNEVKKVILNTSRIFNFEDLIEISNKAKTDEKLQELNQTLNRRNNKILEYKSIIKNLQNEIQHKNEEINNLKNNLNKCLIELNKTKEIKSNFIGLKNKILNDITDRSNDKNQDISLRSNSSNSILIDRIRNQKTKNKFIDLKKKANLSLDEIENNQSFDSETKNMEIVIKKKENSTPKFQSKNQNSNIVNKKDDLITKNISNKKESNEKSKKLVIKVKDSKVNF